VLPRRLLDNQEKKKKKNPPGWWEAFQEENVSLVELRSFFREGKGALKGEKKKRIGKKGQYRKLKTGEGEEHLSEVAGL